MSGKEVEIETKQALVDANRELITRFERKIQQTIARVWGTDTLHEKYGRTLTVAEPDWNMGAKNDDVNLCLKENRGQYGLCCRECTSFNNIWKHSEIFPK